MSRLFSKSTLKRPREVVTEPVEVVPKQSLTEQQKTDDHGTPDLPSWATFEDLGLAEPLVSTCRQLGFKKPTPVQRKVIPFLLHQPRRHMLALAPTGSGKTAAFVLPLIHRLAPDPYGIYAVILTPTRELAKQIHQQVLALGSCYNVTSALVVGGLDAVKQSLELDARPHFCVATPGRLAELLRGSRPPRLKHIRYMVIDETDRLLAPNSGFERDVAELLLHCTTTKENETIIRRSTCQTLLFSATMTKSLESIEEFASGGAGRLQLEKFVIDEGSNGPRSLAVESKKPKQAGQLPAGLRQEYVFMPSRVRDTYLATVIRHLMMNGGKKKIKEPYNSRHGRRRPGDKEDEEDDAGKAQSAIIFVSSCERTALVSEFLSQLGVENVALHSLLSQNRRLAALGKFKSQQVNVLVATDVASRGLDIPHVDLVVNAELPRNAATYIHRVGRTARAGRRGLAVSLVSEADISLVHAAEKASGRELSKCTSVTDDMALKLLSSVTKAIRLAKLKLDEIGFNDLAVRMKERKRADKAERDRIERALKRMAKQSRK